MPSAKLERYSPYCFVGRARGRPLGGLCFPAYTPGMAARTIVYIDGFNLYYGRPKRTSHKWLDLRALCGVLLPQNEIVAIRYFTARVKPRLDNPHVHLRQQAYLAALATIPNLTIHEGHFLEKPTYMPLFDPPPNGERTVKVLKTEEKGSDVALASFLVADGYDGMYEVAVIVSNDSDLVPPITIVRERLGLTVGVLNPHRVTSHALRKVASFYRPIREGAIASCQFPDSIDTSSGTLTRPTQWK